MGKELQPVTRSLEVLDALKEASHVIQVNSCNYHGSVFASPAIKALLELETESETMLSNDPNLSALSVHLSNLRSLLYRDKHKGLIKGFWLRRVTGYSISRVAGSIKKEIQAWIDRESINNLLLALQEGAITEEETLALLARFEMRLSQGFDVDLQELVIKSRIHHSFEHALCHPSRDSAPVQEKCALVICSLIKFHKDVFAGEVALAPLIHSLVSMATFTSLNALSSLIRTVKSPFVDEIESLGEISKLLSYLENKELDMKVSAFDCVLNIGYFGRKEAIEAMLREGIVETLMNLQRTEPGGDLISLGILSRSGSRRWRQSENLENNAKLCMEYPFGSCVARFWVQLEVGEGLRPSEKRAFKLDILQRIRDACICDAEVATIVAEVLWGSSP